MKGKKMSFSGYLLKMGSDTFPLKYVFKESYKITPHRTQDLDSTRNAKGILVRNVLSHQASTITFETKPMWNTDLAAMMKFIRNHYVDPNSPEKKISLTYYSPELDTYDTGNFYVPDIEFPIDRVESNKIFYNSFTLEFIEY